MENKQKLESELLTIMFVDMVGYTKTTTRLSRDKINELHDIFDNISMPVFNKYDGRIIKKIGDAFLVTFKSATNAVLCGVELQNAFHKYNKDNNLNGPLKIRVTLHLGEVLVKNNDVYGDAVNVASRIEGVTKADHITFSEEVFSSINKNEIPYIHLGLTKLKGVKRPIRLFRVKTHAEGMMEMILKKKSRKSLGRNFILALILIIIIALIAWFIIVWLMGI